MSNQVTMWGNVYNLVPDENGNQDLTSCGQCVLSSRSDHKKTLIARGIRPCLDHEREIGIACDSGLFFFTLPEQEAKP